jgi:hypothetical protein
MSRRRFTGCVLSVLALVGVLSPGVAPGAPPTFETIVVDETFPDTLLTEECGVPVTSHIQGRIKIRTFSGEGTGVAEVTSISVGVTATADGRVFRFRDVGADVVRIEPDGTAVLSIAGQVPFAFAGVLKIDLETGEVIFEPRDRSEQQLARACAALTGG